MSKTLILNIRNNAFPMATVRPGTYVVWRNLDPYPHAPKLIQRIAFVDNSFHVFWLPPSGLYTPAPLDPFFPRKAFNRAQPSEFKGGPFRHEVVLAGGTRGQIDVARSLHFDTRLLNHGVFLPDNA